MRGKHLITRSIAFYLKLTLIPAFYNLPCSNFRLKRSPTRKRRHAINQQPVTLNMPVSNQCSPIPSGIKLSAIRKSPDVMKCDLVYENRKDRRRKGYDMLQVLHTTCLGVILTIPFNNRLNSNSL